MKCEAIQRWDRDYDKVSSLIASEEPTMMSAQAPLMRSYAPSAEDFQNAEQDKAVAIPTEVQRSDSERAESEARTEGSQAEDPQEDG